jgi:hypothetical protein
MMRMPAGFGVRAASAVLAAFLLLSLAAGPLASALRATGHPLAADVVLGTRWTLLATCGVLAVALPAGGACRRTAGGRAGCRRPGD